MSKTELSRLKQYIREQKAKTAERNKDEYEQAWQELKHASKGAHNYKRCKHCGRQFHIMGLANHIRFCKFK